MTAVRYHGFDSGNPVSDPVTVLSGLPSQVRVFTDMICLPQFDCLYHEDGSRAPETAIRRGSNLNIESIGPERIDPPTGIPRYQSPLIYLGTFAWNFWGHFLTEGLSRVWYLRHCHRLASSQALFFTRAGDLPWLPHIAAFLDHSDLDPARMMHCKTPLMLSEVHVPAPTMVNRNHAYSGHRESHAIVTRNICGDRPLAHSGQPIYLSRRRLPELHRKTVDEARLESILSHAGARIVCPEEMPFESQVRLFASHRVFIGCIGSGFHSLLFASPEESSRTVVLCDRVINANYRIVDELQNVEADYINCLTVDPKSRKIDPDRILDLDVALHHLKQLGMI